MTDTVDSPPAFRHASRILAISMFVMGACGLVYEYTLGALGNNLMGSSHEQIFVIIGLMMFAMGIGAALQRGIQGHLIEKWLLIEILLGLIGGISTVLIYTAFVYTSSYRVVMYCTAFAIGAFIGMEIPLLIRINQDYSKSLRANLSGVLMMDYVGSLAGALLFAYVLLTRFTLLDIAVYLGLVNVCLGLLGLIYFRSLIEWPKRLTAALAFSLVVLLGVAANTGPILATLEQRCFKDPIIARATTKYQHLVLTKRDDRLSLYVNGHLQFNSDDEAIYHELLTHVPLLAAKHCKRVLILGGGDGLALRDVLKHPRVEEVVLVDIDPEMTKWASQQEDFVRINEGAFHDSRVVVQPAGGTTEGDIVELHKGRRANQHLGGERTHPLAKVRVYNVDADLYLQTVRGSFDVVIVDFPDPRNLEVAKLYSVEFYKYLRAHLAPEGVVAVQSTSPYHAKRVFLCIGATLRKAGLDATPYHHNVPSFGEWGWHLVTHSKAATSRARRRLRALDELPIATTFLTPSLLETVFVFGKSWLAAPDIQPNSKMQSTILAYGREAWRGG